MESLDMCICTDKLQRMSQLPETPKCTALAVRQAARYVTQLYDRHLGEVGLTSSQFSVLVAIATAAAEPTMASVAEALVMDRTTLVRALQPMQRDGLLVQKAASTGRATALHLTPRGLALLKAAETHWRAAQQEIDDKFGADRASALREALFALTTT